MSQIKIVNNFKPLHVDAQRCLSYRKGKLYVHSSISAKPVAIAELPMTGIERLFAQFRITERLLRLDAKVAIPIEAEKYLVSFNGAMHCLDLKTGTMTCEHTFRNGMRNPLSICIIVDLSEFNDCIAYGEYWGNVNRDEVIIYIRENGFWKKGFTFPKGSIRHIHGIIADPFRESVLIFTGDKEDESGIWIARDNFNEVEPLLIGSQNFRICTAFPVAEGILYATDIPMKENYIGIIKKIDGMWKEEKLYVLPGPCMYGTKVGNNYLFSTSVEPDEKIHGIRRLVTYRLGKGVKDRKTHIVAGNADEGFKELLSLKKDLLPMALFQYGNVEFPVGEFEGEGIFYPVATYKYDGKTIKYCLK